MTALLAAAGCAKPEREKAPEETPVITATELPAVTPEPVDFGMVRTPEPEAVTPTPSPEPTPTPDPYLQNV